MLFATAAPAAECLTGVRIISTRASVPNLVNGPAAWSGSVLAVAKTQENASSSIWVGIYDEAFNTLAGDRLITTNSRDLINIVWTGSEFGLFYRTDDARLLVQRLTMLGVPIGEPVRITPNRTVYAGDEIRAVWSDALNAYVVARAVSQGSNQGVWITLLNADGSQRSDRVVNVFATSQSQLDLAVTDGGVIGALYVGVSDNAVLALLNETGPGRANIVTANPGTHLILGTQGEDFLIARQLPNGPLTEVRWLIVDTSHQVVMPDTLLVAGTGDDAWPLAFEVTDDEIAVSYVNSPRRDDATSNQYRLRRLKATNHSLLSDTPFAGNDLQSSRAISDHRFFWTGVSYISAPVRSAPDRLNSYLVRYCPLVAEISVTDNRIRAGDSITFTGQGTGGVPNYTYVWRFSNELTPDAGQVQTRTFTDPGTYTATVTVTDATGSTDTTSFVVQVFRPKHRAVRH
jgi:hypothetical protein